ncbi:hypothetical protein B0H17DRAFT_1190788 [Mycena rosella]|uniref:F-box domain-containing protein n=1 Tax=Mycena rosella TaxID=1033263 RepID=A0AAD7MBI9_MYCRO|nr:hypothetical protein B0H17DRAFT_1190788 [Mycena rosella]
MAGSLPSDVLIEVFHLLPRPELYWDRYSLIDVAGVNKAWRTAALESASLWSCIRTEHRRDLLLLPLLLERSRTSSLDVRLDLFCNEYGNVSADSTPQERAEVVQALLPHARRIQKLYIRHPTLEPTSEDTEAILHLVDVGLEFTILTEYTHERMGDDTAESDTPLNFTGPNLLKLSVDGTRPRQWSTLLAATLVELHIGSMGTPIDMDLLGTIFQQCGSLSSLELQQGFDEDHTPLSPGSQWRFTPPPSIRTLDLTMPMSEIIAVLGLFLSSPLLHSVTVCDDQGLTARVLGRKRPHPILTHMLRGLDSLIAFEVYTDQDILLRDAAGRARRFQVTAEDDPCYETGALWAFLVARYAAHRTVRTVLGTTSAWSWLVRALDRHQPDPPAESGVELQIVMDDYGSFQQSCASGDTPTLYLAALSTLTLMPPTHAAGRAQCSVEAVLHMLSMVRSERRGVVVCIGELMLKGVPPHVVAYQTLADGLASVGPTGMWSPCAHCAARAAEIRE